MSAFKEMVEQDIMDVFLNADEFAETHNLNGWQCVAIVQDCVINDDLTTTNTEDARYTDGLYGVGAVINVKKTDIPDMPKTGNRFRLNGRYGHVVAVNDDMGMLTITWAANES